VHTFQRSAWWNFIGVLAGDLPHSTSPLNKKRLVSLCAQSLRGDALIPARVFTGGPQPHETDRMHTKYEMGIGEACERDDINGYLCVHGWVFGGEEGGSHYLPPSSPPNTHRCYSVSVKVLTCRIPKNKRGIDGSTSDRRPFSVRRALSTSEGGGVGSTSLTNAWSRAMGFACTHTLVAFSLFVFPHLHEEIITG